MDCEVLAFQYLLMSSDDILLIFSCLFSGFIKNRALLSLAVYRSHVVTTVSGVLYAT